MVVVMHEIRVITIPENAEDLYTEEYFENLGHEAAEELVSFMNKCLDEINNG